LTASRESSGAVGATFRPRMIRSRQRPGKTRSPTSTASSVAVVRIKKAKPRRTKRFWTIDVEL